MSEKPIAAVVSATSKQGSSVVQSLLQSGKYRVRGLTRNPESDDSKKLAQRGVEIVAADPLNKDQLKNAFRGAFAVYSLTPVFPPEFANQEFESGKIQGDAALEEGVKHFIFSGLENVEKVTNGALVVPHFTIKAKIEEYLRTLQGLNSYFVYLGIFYTNIIEYYVPQKQTDGSLVFSTPSPADSQTPFVDPTSAPGPVVLAILENPEEYRGKVVPLVGDVLTFAQLVETFSRVTGIPAKYEQTSKELFFQIFPSGLADELWQMFEYFSKHGYYTPERDLTWNKRIDPNVRTFEDFLRITQWKGESFTEWKKRNMY